MTLPIANTIVQRVWNYCHILRDESLVDSANLPDPDVLTVEVAMEQFKNLADALGEPGKRSRLLFTKQEIDEVQYRLEELGYFNGFTSAV